MSSMGGGSPGPTAQQQALSTLQATTGANLNLEENSQRKIILNAMQGTRSFRGSALSRSVGGDNDAAPMAQPGAPSESQINTYGQITTTPTASLLDTVQAGTTTGGAQSGSSGGARGGPGGGARGGNR